MAGRFISGGKIDSDGAVVNDASGEDSKPAFGEPKPGRNSQWEAVQQELEAERRRRDEKRVKAATGEEKSLYDILQENKGTFHAKTLPQQLPWSLKRVPSCETSRV
jgi:hypothetical protein